MKDDSVYLHHILESIGRIEEVTNENVPSVKTAVTAILKSQR